MSRGEIFVTSKLSASIVFLLLLAICIHSPVVGAQGIQIESVKVFSEPNAAGDKATFFLEISGNEFGDDPNKLKVHVTPQAGVVTQPKVLSASPSVVVSRFEASPSYSLRTVLLVRNGVGASSFDLQPVQITTVEVLRLDRRAGLGRIAIEGKGFGDSAEGVRVIIVPRNPRLSVYAPHKHLTPSAVEDEEVADATDISPSIQEISDSTIVVEFSFPHGGGYSKPFRIAKVVVRKMLPQEKQTYSVSLELLPKRQRDLVSHYTILSTEQAKSRFGAGIAKNFYAIELSVVNNGARKVQIPLASIEAEVEWASGIDGIKVFLEGPITVSPVPLAGVTSFFSNDRKASGKRAWFFNLLQGLTTVGSAIESFFGPGFSRGVSIAGGGFRQGAQKVFPDMSEEQLANLTSQSFESVETASPSGGSIGKVIFIQRGREIIETFNKKRLKAEKLITNILGLEVFGYEVIEEQPTAATVVRTE